MSRFPDYQGPRSLDPQCDDGTYPDTHVRCNGCGAHWKINTLSGCHECDMTLQDMRDAGVYEEIEVQEEES